MMDTEVNHHFHMVGSTGIHTVAAANSKSQAHTLLAEFPES